MTGRARILMLVTELSMGGAARVVREVSAMLRQRHEVHEAVFNTADGVDFAGTVAPHSLDVAGGGSPLRKLANLWARVDRLRRLKRALRTELSISHLEGAHWVDVLSRRGEKIVLCVHGSILQNRDIRGLTGWLRRRFVLPLIYNRADRIVTVSRDLAPELVALGVRKDKIRTINNAFDLDAIAEDSRQPLPEDHRSLFQSVPVLVTAGRMAAQKNQAALIDVFAAVRRERAAKLVILGDGELRKNLIAQAERTGLSVSHPWSGQALDPSADIVFLGVQANPFRYLARAAAFALPSAWEGFPLALCEAMACGAPVLAADCPTGPREILAPESSAPSHPVDQPERSRFGLLMPRLDLSASHDRAQSAWAQTVVRLLDDPDEQAALAAAGRVRMADFSKDKIAGQWFALVEELFGASPQ